MATTVAVPSKVRSDDIFFPAMALLILGIVVTGFGRSYFLAGMIRAKLPNGLVHVHGAVFVLWIFLVAVQPWLVAAHKVKWHTKLGLLSLVLLPWQFWACLLCLISFVAHNPRKVRNFSLWETWRYSFCSRC